MSDMPIKKYEVAISSACMLLHGPIRTVKREVALRIGHCSSPEASENHADYLSKHGSVVDYWLKCPELDCKAALILVGYLGDVFHNGTSRSSRRRNSTC